MNKGMLQGIIIGAVVVTAGAALARYKPWDASDKNSFESNQQIAAQSGAAAADGAARDTETYAVVTRVEPATKTVRNPRQVCQDVQVTQQKPIKDEHKVAGSVIGAVVGGVVGNQVGHGAGKTLATIAGAAGGGYAGNRIQNRVQKGNTETVTQQKCETVYDTSEKPSGYRVTYQLDGRTETVSMDRDPGDRIPVRDGHVVIASR